MKIDPATVELLYLTDWNGDLRAAHPLDRARVHGKPLTQPERERIVLATHFDWNASVGLRALGGDARRGQAKPRLRVLDGGDGHVAVSTGSS